MSEKHLGKISKARYGIGGYDDAQFGLSLMFEFDKCCGVGTFDGFWTTERTKHCKWTEDDRSAGLAATARLVLDTLTKAKKRSVEELVGVPVELTMEGNTLKSWRVLEEVL